MIRSLWAMMLLLSVGIPSIQAQCSSCARPNTTKPAGYRAVPLPVPNQLPTAPSHDGTSASTSCPSCAKATTDATTKTVGCPHCKAGSESVVSEKTGGDEKPVVKVEKEVTLTGTLICAKCGLKDASVKKCTNALQVKNGEKTITYFLADQGNKESYHEGICGGGTKEGIQVTGIVFERDGHLWIKGSK